jgi:hypothetical protein
MLRLESASGGPRFCDGVSRRGFLRIGGLSMGGLSMPALLRAQETAPARTRSGGLGHKAVIMVYLPGGPPHQDMFDLKMDAPSNIRGELRPIRTNVAGVQFCELLPRLAGMMDKLAVLRSVVGAKDRHESFQCLTGRLNENLPRGGWPELGAVVSRLQGASGRGLPPFVALSPRMQHRPYNNGTPGFLGSAHSPFKPEDEGKDDLKLNGVSLERLEDRKGLLASLDRLRREVDSTGALDGVDSFTEQAFGVLTSNRLAAALDLTKEDPKVRERYGTGTTQHQGDGAPRINQQFLLARRLVEAGVRCVTLSYSFWDWHGKSFENARRNLPDFDKAMSALVSDLHERGLDRDVTVIAWGEFGRTPVINKDGGRDHWPRVSCALLAGGGLRTGQVVGSTTRDGGEADSRPVTFQEVFATLYRTIGIDVEVAQVVDFAGRPHYLVDPEVKPIRELV